MSILRTLPSVAAACGLTLFAVAAVKAQDAPPPPAGPAAHGQMVERHGMVLDRMAHRRAEHLRLIHDALNIRSDQEGAWQAFAASMTPQPGQWEHERMGGDDWEHMTAPQRADRMVARAQARLAAAQRHAAAVKALYAALTPAQQRTFDALVALHMHGMHGGWGGPEMKHGMGGHEGMDDDD